MMGFPDNLNLRLMDARKIQASKLEALATGANRTELHRSVHAHSADIVKTNYLIDRHAAFNEGVDLIHRDDPEGPNLESFEGEQMEEELRNARRTQLETLQERKTEKQRSRAGTHARHFIPSELKNYLLMKMMILNDFSYTKTMLTGMPINLGGKTKNADWDNFILRVINRDLKLKDMVLRFLPACTSVKQFTTKLRESLLLANPHGILFLPKTQASFHVKPSSPKRLKVNRIIARCESSSSDEDTTDNEIIPGTQDQRLHSSPCAKGVKRTLQF